MAKSTLPRSTNGLGYLNLEDNVDSIWNLSPPELYEEAIRNGEAILTGDYVLRVMTGKYTGRSPADRFIVDQPSIHDDIDWGSINQPITEEVFEHLFSEVTAYLCNRKLYVKDCYAGADEKYQLNVRVVSEAAYHSLFAHNMFVRPSEEALKNHIPDFTVLAAPHFKADPSRDGTSSEAFILINFEKKLILIGGTLYSGEVKKGIFYVMNYLLPQQQVMAMHCSANTNDEGNAALFFGLSGTGKTTLSSDESRILIGDDEHGWSEDGIFNIEGGCYAKTINLSAENEPLIYATTKIPGTILENVALDEDRRPDFTDVSLTQNTRCAYPIHYIPNASDDGTGHHPSNVIFLTCDAFGVLPPISRLTPEQAMYHFISGYTAKIAGTERGVAAPKATFSACFGAPFMPLHPVRYATLLADKLRQHNTSVWFLNTGWTGGPHGVGRRMSLPDTRRILSEVLSGNIEKTTFKKDPIFGLSIPVEVQGVPGDILDPRNSWDNSAAYNRKANQLASMFAENFAQYEQEVSKNITEAGPKI
ncbi:phosphoenolpyruvate carboxykinase (ATP) [Fodinibius sediminis]|uniref:Phosphoenolpyruvate carboxykinase (ATP) n=1 Tax=Fodinibius sediminis TaxID=1214077 RepID=A0A521B2C8_9BACT|nr:phosphoenolpyruvate carboxykinase (ATP) [Fodinibius sediminis]SMO40930.1 phosphoenolpyruvate carboxykinase (ATP) [Fodinibius sediminis]